MTMLDATRILQSIISLAREPRAIADDLASAGFSAFVPYQRFVESFAASDVELQTHRLFVAESARARLVEGAVYTSKFVEDLKQAAKNSPLARDPATEPITRYHWDPCEQNMRLLGMMNPREFDRRERAMMEERRHFLETEVRVHSKASETSLGMLIKPTRFRFAAEVLAQELSEFGFERTKSKATNGGIISRKNISDSLCIEWAIVDPQLFYFNQSKGTLVLGVRCRDLHAVQPMHADGDQVTIRYQSFIYGFSNSYIGFSSLQQLETILKAHVHLYGLLSSAIESALSDAATVA